LRDDYRRGNISARITTPHQYKSSPSGGIFEPEDWLYPGGIPGGGGGIKPGGGGGKLILSTSVVVFGKRVEADVSSICRVHGPLVKTSIAGYSFYKYFETSIFRERYFLICCI
jgi:hypothetical protein